MVLLVLTVAFTGAERHGVHRDKERSEQTNTSSQPTHADPPATAISTSFNRIRFLFVVVPSLMLPQLSGTVVDTEMYRDRGGRRGAPSRLYHVQFTPSVDTTPPLSSPYDVLFRVPMALNTLRSMS